jgi:hypothetical protein
MANKNTSSKHTARARLSPLAMLPVFAEVVIYGLLIFEMWSLWTHPGPADFARIQTLALLMGFEFFMVHSALFFNLMPRKVSVLFLLPVYWVIAYFLNTGAENNVILYLYLGLLIIRLRFLFEDHTDIQKARATKISIGAGLIYFGAIGVIAVGETGLPAKGLNPDFFAQENYYETLNVGGIFTEQPHLPLIMGIIYFSMMIVFELYLLFLRPPRIENHLE